MKIGIFVHRLRRDQRTGIGVGRKPFKFLALSVGFKLLVISPACGINQDTRIKTFEAVRDVYVQILPTQQGRNEIQIILKSQKFSSLAICQGTMPCSPENPGYRKARLVQQKSDFLVFGFDRSFGVSDSLVFTVVDATTNDVLRKFRLRSSSTPADPLQTGMAQINKQLIEKELYHLASDQFNGRLSATKDHEAAADFITENLKNLNIPPLAPGNYRQAFTMSRGPTAGQTTHNIIAVLEGSDPILKNEYIVIGAHLDHTGTMQKGHTCSFRERNDPICNGADDNASGSITVLTQARSLAAIRKELKRSVIFMWFSGEEEGLLGSAFYVRNPLVPLAKTVYMINIDMVGYLRSNNSTLMALGGGTSRAGKQVIETVSKKYPEIKVRISDKAGGGSDHVNFMGKGIPGVFFHTGVRSNPNYHKTSDSADKIDYDGMFTINKIIFETLLTIATGGATKTSDGLMLATESTDGFSGGESREPLVTPEEMAQSCHHLMENPYTE